MSKQTVVVLCCVLLTAVGALSKERAWQTGKVLDSDRASRYVGNIGSTSSEGRISEEGTYRSNSNSSSTAIYRVYQMYAMNLEITSMWRSSACDGNGRNQPI